MRIRAVVFDCFGVLYTTPAVRNTKLFLYCKALKEQGYRLAVLSNATIHTRDSLFTDEDRQLFDEIMVSEATGLIKPDPDAYWRMSHYLLLDPAEILFIDDSSDNVQGALAIGMKALQFTATDETIMRIEEVLNA